jgi:hypothetical protein
VGSWPPLQTCEPGVSVRPKSNLSEPLRRKAARSASALVPGSFGAPQAGLRCGLRGRPSFAGKLINTDDLSNVRVGPRGFWGK